MISDDEMENEIDSNLDQLHGAAKRLNQLGRAMGEETDTQNKHIGRYVYILILILIIIGRLLMFLVLGLSKRRIVWMIKSP